MTASHADLVNRRREGFEQDRAHFAEQRVHSKLVAGQHYKMQDMEVPSEVYIDRGGNPEMELSLIHI